MTKPTVKQRRLTIDERLARRTETAARQRLTRLTIREYRAEIRTAR